MSDRQQAGRGWAVVAGATGYLGGHVVQTLKRDGWQVRALARDPARLGVARGSCDEVFVGEATQPSTLKGLFAGADVAFSSIGIRHFRRRPTYREVDQDANLGLVEAAEQAGVTRFVFVSVLDGQRVRSVSPLVEARERVVERLHSSPMTSTILRPTGFFNDMAEIFEMARRGRVWLIGDGRTRINPIHGADLAEVAAEVLRSSAPPAERSVGGPDTFTQHELAQLAFEALGTPARTGRVPAAVVTLLGLLATPFSPNAGALLRMFALLGRRDAVGEAVGRHHLADFFAELAPDETSTAQGPATTYSSSS